MAKVKILVVVVQKDVVVIDADGLAKTRLVAHLAAYALHTGSRRKYEGDGQCARRSRYGDARRAPTAPTYGTILSSTACIFSSTSRVFSA